MTSRLFLRPDEHPSNWERCNCGNLSEMSCVCEGVYDSRTHDEDNDDWVVSYYKVLRCPACKQVTVIRHSAYERADHERPEVEPEYTEYEREVLYAPAKPRHYSIPSAIADVAGQAEKVASASPRAAFVLCRAGLEELCREHNIPETITNAKGQTQTIDLKKRLNLLFEREKLPQDLREIIHGIRYLGNISAHTSQSAMNGKITASEVEGLLGLLDYVLDRLYVDKARTKEAVDNLNTLKAKVSGSKTDQKEGLDSDFFS